VAVKDFDQRAWCLTNNRNLLVKHGIMKQDSNAYKYLFDFVRLEIDLGIHKVNGINSDAEFKNAIKHCKSIHGPRITSKIA